MTPQELLNIPKTVLQRELFNRSYYHFFKWAWDIVETKEMVENWHIKYLCDEVETVFRWSMDFDSQPDDAYNLVINVPPGTSKSSIVSKIGIVWAWATKPDLQIISSSFTASMVAGFTDKMLMLIRSDEFKEVYPDFQLRIDNVGEQKTKKGARYTASTGNAIISKHADLHIVDDPNKPPSLKRDRNGRVRLSEGASMSEIENANAWYNDQLSTRVTDKEKSRFIIIQQRVHSRDLTGHLLQVAQKGGHWKFIVLPGEGGGSVIEYHNGIKTIKKVDYELLDTKRLSKHTLDTMRGQLGSYVYNAQIMQKPSLEGIGLLNRKMFKVVDSSTIPNNLVRFYYTDPSEGKKNSDNMATICWSLYEGKMVVWEIAGVVKPFNEYIGARDSNGEYQNKFYDDFVERTGASKYSKHFFEAKSSGSAYIQYMNAHTPYSAIGDNPSGSKLDRVNLSMGFIESSRVLLVEGHWIDDFLNEAENFTGRDGDPDDRIDVLTGAIKYTDFNGSVFEPTKEQIENIENGDNWLP